MLRCAKVSVVNLAASKLSTLSTHQSPAVYSELQFQYLVSSKPTGYS
jgi:hypothetical protein